VPAAARKNAPGLADTLEKLIFDEINAGLIQTRPPGLSPVRLVPCYHYESKADSYLTLSVGRERMHSLKNISNFLSNVRREETVSYGNGLRFNHTLHSFDDESRKLLEFLLREDTLYTEIIQRLSKQSQYHAQSARANPRSVALTERNMDAFFDICYGSFLDAEISGPARLKCTDEMPDIRLHLTHEPHSVHLTAEEFDYRVQYGIRHQYLISKTAMHRLPKNDAQIITHLLRAFSASQDSKVVFSGGEHNRFLSIILPKLTRLGLITSVEGQPPVRTADELSVKLYFDGAVKDITGRVDFHYGDTVINPLEESAADVLRDVAAEYAVKRRLALQGFRADGERREYVLADNELIYAFLCGGYEDGNPVTPGIETLRDCGEVFISENLKQKSIKTQTPSVGLRIQGGLLDIRVDDAGYTLHDLLEALDAYREKKKFYRLKDGRFMPLEGEAVSLVANILAGLDVSKREVRGNSLVMPAYRALYVDELTAGQRGNRSISRSHDFQVLVNQFKSKEARVFEIPHSIKDVLREYQKTGYQWLKTLARYSFGGILADDMGLGKTIQVIAVLLSDKKPGTKSLVVAPTSLLYNWEHEIRRFAPELRTVLITGLPDRRRDIIQTADADIFITTYDTMKRDISAYEGINFEYIIADEAQNIKNPATQNARAIKEISARVKFALTGTPIENTLSELWSIFDFIMPGYLHSSHKFNRLYEYPIVKDNDKARAEKLRNQIGPFLLRRVKKNVLTELPDKTETILLAELTPEQKKIYMANLLLAKGEINSALVTGKGRLDESRMRILAQLTRLRQICCHPGLFAQNYEGGSGKLELALETIQMTVESRHRLLIFSQFTSMLDIIKKALDNTPYRYFYLDGAVKPQDRIEMTERFNAGECDLFLISLKAGGTGLNLTGADVVIHYDPWWNPSVMDQASDRAHRYGQEKAVQIFNLVAKDTIEEKIMELQEKKRNLIDSVITEGGTLVSSLTDDELKGLFEQA
jgi:superfamily II DNA or RNA helicase